MTLSVEKMLLHTIMPKESLKCMGAPPLFQSFLKRGTNFKTLFASLKQFLSLKSSSPLRREAKKKGNTVKTLKIGTPRLTTVVVLNIKHYDFSMQ